MFEGLFMATDHLRRQAPDRFVVAMNYSENNHYEELLSRTDV